MQRTDNTLRGANNLGNLTLKSIDSDVTTSRNKINRNDPNDLFRFKLNRSQLVSIEVLATKKNADLDLELYQFKRPKRKVLQAIGQKDWKDLKGSVIRRNLERIERSNDGSVVELIRERRLDKGMYYIRVKQVKKPTKYALNLFTRKDALSVPNPMPDNGFNIAFDYRFDTQGWFTPEKRAALEAAADAWESHIKDEFPDVPAGIEISLLNPITNEATPIRLDTPIDDLLIFVGTQSPPFGNPNFSEKAAAAGFSPNTTGSIFSNRIKGSNFEPWAGAMSIDPTKDFFFDPTPSTDNDIPPGKSDFIDTAIHEIGHVLGLVRADIIAEFLDGTFFEGPNALSTYGGPVPFDSDLGHIQAGTTIDGQPVVIAGANPSGRELPTRLDLAILADIGYDIDGFVRQGSTPPIATNGDDRISGTVLADTLDGLGGNDQLFGNEGNDQLFGNGGNDQIQGGAGDDLIQGGPGDDVTLFGGDGNDNISGNGGSDQIQGGPGNDVIQGGPGDDLLFGEAGRDRFVFAAQGSGEDRISGFVVADDQVAIASLFGFSDGQEVFNAVMREGNATSGGLFSEFQLADGDTLTIFHDRPLTAQNFIIV